MAKITRPLLPGQSRPQQSYPHVPNVADPHAQQSLALLWDSHATVKAQLDTALATIATLTKRVTLNESATQAAAAAASAASINSGIPVTSTFVPGGGPGGGPATGPGGGPPSSTDPNSTNWDNGQGYAGFSAAGPNGHVAGGSPLSFFTAGQIVGGTGNEFPHLLDPVATVEIRRANILTMRLRIIWHLQLAGFTAGQNRNPSGAVGINAVTFQVDGVWRAFQVIFSPTYDRFDVPGNLVIAPLSANETNYIPDGGLGD